MPRQASKPDTPEADEPKSCGVIMPISDHPDYPSGHWKEIQILVHRAIERAGMIPHNVWDDATTERITDRIIPSLFADPFAICDVSSLNPNVMFELGLRLSSGKPTIVIRQSGLDLPFDLKDLPAIPYPVDKSMLPMERFIQELADRLTEIDCLGDKYKPFIKQFTIDVVQPEVRTVDAGTHLAEQIELMLSRIQAIDERVRRLDVRRNSENLRDRIAAGAIMPSRISDGFPEAVGDASHSKRYDLIKFPDTLLHARINGVAGVQSVHQTGNSLYVKYSLNALGGAAQAQVDNIIKLFEQSPSEYNLRNFT